MAIWRSATLEALVGGMLDSGGLNDAFLQSLVADGVSEGEQLEFKIELPAAGSQQQGWTPAQEFAKDVAALANARGGLLIYGVEETSGVATGIRAISGVEFEAEERRLRQALANFQAPIATVDFVNVASGSGFCIAIVVPPSPQSPHAVLGNPGDSRKPLYYPARHGADTMYLTESEVAERYRRRTQAAADLADTVRKRIDGGQEALGRSEGYWAYVAVAPELPLVSPLDPQVVKDTDTWHMNSMLMTPLGRHLGLFGVPIPIPGGVSFTGSASSGTDETLPEDAYIELHVDGAAFAGRHIADHLADTAASVQGLTLSQDVILLVDKALRWTTERVGGGGQATLAVGIYDASGLVINDWDNGLALLTDSGNQIPRTRLLEREPRTELAVDLGHASTQQGRLAVAYSALSSLLQWFGLAETELLTRDEVIRARNWAGRYTEVHRRAAEWDLPSTLDP
jgi:hypothetical protein